MGNTTVPQDVVCHVAADLTERYGKWSSGGPLLLIVVMLFVMPVTAIYVVVS